MEQYADKIEILKNNSILIGSMLDCDKITDLADFAEFISVYKTVNVCDLDIILEYIQKL